MIDSQQLYLNRCNRLSKLNLSPEPDFLSLYSDALLVNRLGDAEAAAAGNSRQQSALIVGARSNHLYGALKDRYNEVDQWPMAMVMAKGMEAGAFESTTQVETVICPHVIDWLNPNAFLPQAIAAIKPGGDLFFSFYGESTALNLVALFATEDPMPYFQPKYAMSDVGDHIARLGLSNVVIDSERLNLEYHTVEKLIEDARPIDGANFHPARRQSLMPKGVYQRIMGKLQQQLEAEGVLTVAIELCYGRGLKKDNSSVKVAAPSWL